MVYRLVRLAYFMTAPSLLLVTVAVLFLVVALRWPRLGWLGATATVSLLTAAGVFPIGAFLAAPLEAVHPRPSRLPDRVDGIIVLGGFTTPGAPCDFPELPLNDAAERLLEALVLARRYPTAKFVVSGGGWNWTEIRCSEAELTARFLDRYGMDPSRIVVENHSRNTRGNAVFTYEAVNPEPGSKWILVTSAMHMPRAVASFRAVGFDVIPWPVDYASLGVHFHLDLSDLPRNWRTLDRAAHEWLGLVWYRWRGWLDKG